MPKRRKVLEDKGFLALPFLTGIFFSTTQETKGHKGKKPKKHPLCAFVTLRGKGFPARNGRAGFFSSENGTGGAPELYPGRFFLL
ncbi:hypothetical protein FBQ99_05465 [Chloroflexi bacterium CFX2]|nr:hypothetical protein [Chloroflexi bacterium CFX2]